MSIKRTHYRGGLLLVLSLLLMTPWAAVSEDRSGYSNSPHLSKQSREPLGDQTRALLDLQTSGDAASDTDHSLPSGVRSRIYLRYLESFEHPVPDLFFDPDQRATRR